jgi:fructose-specific phosphotransferase system IIC component
MSQSSNPYESPKQPSAQRVLKAGIGSLTILLLMPVAMFVAFCIGCGISVVSVDALFSQNYDAMILFAIIVSWGPPLVVMIAMLLWRRKVKRQELEAARQAELHEHAQN